MTSLSHAERVEGINLILEGKLKNKEIAKKLRMSPRAVDAIKAWITIHNRKYNEYSEDWPEISRRIRDRSGGQCECVGECELHKSRRCTERNQTPARYAKGRIVLTVAHLDHNKKNNSDDNLRAMCQRCHLRYDAKLHVINRKRKNKLKSLK